MPVIPPTKVAKVAKVAKAAKAATAAKATQRRGPSSARHTPARRGAAPAQPAALSRPLIVQTALALVADEGVSGFSTRKLGERLGCEAMSIYHHFPSKQHLLDALVDEVVGALEWPPLELSPLARVRAAMYAFRKMAHRHPAFFPYVAVHRLNTPTGVAFIERILAIVQAVVPDAERAARHFRTMGYYLVGAALDETAGYARGPTSAEPVDGPYILRECPRLAASAHYFEREHWDRTFELGVQALLHAMAQDDSGVAA